MPHTTSTLLFAFAVSYAAPADDFGLLTRTSRLTVEEKAVAHCRDLRVKIATAHKVPIPCQNAAKSNNEMLCGKCMSCHSQCGGPNDVAGCFAHCLKPPALDMSKDNVAVPTPPPVKVGKTVVPILKVDKCTTLKKHVEKALIDAGIGGTKAKVPKPCIDAAEVHNNEEKCGTCLECHKKCHAHKGAHDEECIAKCLRGEEIKKPAVAEPKCQVLKKHLGQKALASVTDGSQAKYPCILAVSNGNEQVCGVCVHCHEQCAEHAPKRGVQHQNCLVACVKKEKDKRQQKQLALLQRSSRVVSCKKLGEEHRSLAKLSNVKDDVRLFKGAPTEVKQQLRSLAETCFGELNGLGKDTALKRSKKKIPACFLRNKGDKVGFVNCLGF